MFKIWLTYSGSADDRETDNESNRKTVFGRLADGDGSLNHRLLKDRGNKDKDHENNSDLSDVVSHLCPPNAFGMTASALAVFVENFFFCGVDIYPVPFATLLACEEWDVFVSTKFSVQLRLLIIIFGILFFWALGKKDHVERKCYGY